MRTVCCHVRPRNNDRRVILVFAVPREGFRFMGFTKQKNQDHPAQSRFLNIVPGRMQIVHRRFFGGQERH